MTKEAWKYYLRRTPLAYQAAEALYENALYVPVVWRQHLSAVVSGLRTGVFRRPAGQAVLTWDVPFPRFDRPGDLVTWLRSQGVEVSEGGHTFYIAPQPALRRIIPAVVDFYPPQSGFKVLRDFRDPLRARYIYKHPRSLKMLKRLIGTPRDQLIVANYMHVLGIGPRVWDTCGWRTPWKCCTAFVVDHVTGRQPSMEQVTAFLARLEHLNARTDLRILIPRWRQCMDFQPPDCNHNLLYSDALGRVQYVDFQNFGLRDRGVRWRQMAVAPHASRWSSISTALDRAGIDLDRRLVLDVGCGDGTQLHASLGAGAAWGIGWDRPDVVSRTTSRLLSHGSARFSLIGADLSEPHELADDVPQRLQHLLPRAVVFSPAGRGDLAALQRACAIPCGVLVCEGDGSDSPAHVVERAESSAEAAGTGRVEVLASVQLRDASDSDTCRPVVVLRRHVVHALLYASPASSR